MKHSNLYTVKQISAITGFSIATIYDKITRLNLSPEITNKGLSYFDEKSFNFIIKALEIAPKEKSFTKFYPIKTTETFYIYESKMNAV